MVSSFLHWAGKCPNHVWSIDLVAAIVTIYSSRSHSRSHKLCTPFSYLCLACAIIFIFHVSSSRLGKRVQAKISTKDYVWLALYLFLLSLDQISWMLDDDRVVDIGIQIFFCLKIWYSESQVQDPRGVYTHHTIKW